MWPSQNWKKKKKKEEEEEEEEEERKPWLTMIKAKEELWKLKYFTMQKYNLSKILPKKPKSFKILLL